MSAAAFAAASHFVLLHEGGLVDNPADSGGITAYGISIKFAGSIHLDLDGDGKTTRADIIAMTPERACVIYRKYFWDKCRLGEMPPPLALVAFDCAVNQGPYAAAKILQRVIGARADGIVGNRTVAAANRIANLTDAIGVYCGKRGKRYAGTRGVKIFGAGWFRRLAECHTAAAEFAVLMGRGLPPGRV